MSEWMVFVDQEKHKGNLLYVYLYNMWGKNMKIYMKK